MRVFRPQSLRDAYVAPSRASSMTRIDTNLVTKREYRVNSCDGAHLRVHKRMLAFSAPAILTMVGVSVGCLAASADPLFRQLEPFSGVQSTLPFLIDITVDEGQESYFQLHSSRYKSIDEIMRIVRKEAGLLSLEMLPNIRLKGENSATLSVSSAGSLLSLSVIGAGQICMNGSAATKDSFSLVSNGAANIAIKNGPFKSLRTVMTGAGYTAVNGSSIEELEFKSNGAGEAIFGGVTGSVKLLMRGAGSTKILGTDAVDITGQIQGIGKVLYNNGSCSVTSTVPSKTPCKKSADLTLPKDLCELRSSRR